MIIIKEHIASTLRNEEGYALFCLMDREFNDKGEVHLSFKGCTALSSSFLNSSFGELYEKHGFAALKGKIRLADITARNLSEIKKYLNTIQALKK